MFIPVLLLLLLLHYRTKTSVNLECFVSYQMKKILHYSMKISSDNGKYYQKFKNRLNKKKHTRYNENGITLGQSKNKINTG